MNRPLIAAIQMSSRQNKAENLAAALRLIESAAKRGAQLVALPEMFTLLGTPEEMVAAAEPLTGPTSEALGDAARRWQITLIGGSFPEQAAGPGRICNTTLVFAPDGRIQATYRKVHLFDIDLPEMIYRESDFTDAGQEIIVTETSVGRVGLGTCYDLRFPELFRRLVELGAEIIAIPSAFVLNTGRDHWEVLLRARAIENQAYLLAPNQFGQHTPRLTTYGRSMIIDPWGTVLATVPDGEGVILAELDLPRQRQVRRYLPALTHRRKIEQLAAKTDQPRS